MHFDDIGRLDEVATGPGADPIEHLRPTDQNKLGLWMAGQKGFAGWQHDRRAMVSTHAIDGQADRPAHDIVAHDLEAGLTEKHAGRPTTPHKQT
jgi:hypothetical protein